MTKTKLDKEFEDKFGNIYIGDVPLREIREDIRKFISDNYIPKEELIETIKGMKDIRDNKIKVYAGENGQILSNCNDYQKAHNQALKETIKIIKEL